MITEAYCRELVAKYPTSEVGGQLRPPGDREFLGAKVVDSFEVEGAVDGRGTVAGNSRTPENPETGETGGTGTSGSTYFSCTTPYPTNDFTCAHTCANTCGSTCAVYPVMCA